MIAGALVLCVAAAALAQRRFDDRGGFGGYGRAPSFDTAPGGFWAGGRPAWAHGYPLAEEHLMRIMDDLSFFNARTDTINVISLEDPELFKYPLAYIIEVGWWTLTDAGAAALRT